VAGTRHEPPDSFLDAWIAENVRGRQVVTAGVVETMKTGALDRLGLEVIEVEVEDAPPTKRGAKRKPLKLVRDNDTLPLESEVADTVIVETAHPDPPFLARLMSEAVRVARPHGRLMLLVAVPSRAEDAALEGAVHALLAALPRELKPECIDAWGSRLAVVASVVDADDTKSIEQRLVRELTRTALRASELEQIVRDLQEGIARRDRLASVLSRELRETREGFEMVESDLAAERAARAELAAEHDVVQQRLALRAQQVADYRASRWYRIGQALWRVRHWRRP
jgi:SAM-dependent methyltransferase